MSGPLEELRAADERLAAVERRLVGDGLPHYDDDPEWMDANAKFKAAARALAASGPGRPTTGATTGDDDGSPWAKCPDRERCIGFVRCLTDRDCPAEPFAAPPSTGAESRDDR